MVCNKTVGDSFPQVLLLKINEWTSCCCRVLEKQIKKYKQMQIMKHYKLCGVIFSFGFEPRLCLLTKLRNSTNIVFAYHYYYHYYYYYYYCCYYYYYYYFTLLLLWLTETIKNGICWVWHKNRRVTAEKNALRKNVITL